MPDQSRGMSTLTSRVPQTTIRCCPRRQSWEAWACACGRQRHRGVSGRPGGAGDRIAAACSGSLNPPAGNVSDVTPPWSAALFRCMRPRWMWVRRARCHTGWWVGSPDSVEIWNLVDLGPSLLPVPRCPCPCRCQSGRRLEPGSKLTGRRPPEGHGLDVGGDSVTLTPPGAA